MKKIIFYYDGAQYWLDKYKHNADEIAMGAQSEKELFESLGYPGFLCNSCSWQDMKEVLRLFKNNEVYFTMGINAAGLDIYLEDGRGLYECYDIPHISTTADQPYSGCDDSFYMGRLINSRCNNLIIGTSNGESVIEYMKMEKFQSKIQDFYINRPYIEVGEYNERPRDIEVLHTGRMYDSTSPKREWNSILISKKKKDILNEVADYLENQAVTVYDAFKYVLNEHKILHLMEIFHPFFLKVFWYTVHWRRLKLVETLLSSGITLTMCDHSWRDYKYASKLNVLGTDRRGTDKLYSRAKILVADLAGFNHSIHGRNLRAMAGGAVVVSEYTPFMDDEFLKKNAVRLFNWNEVETVPKLVKELLSNDNERINIARNAFHIVKNNFSPLSHAKMILNFVDGYLKRRGVKAGGE